MRVEMIHCVIASEAWRSRFSMLLDCFTFVRNDGSLRLGIARVFLTMILANLSYVPALHAEVEPSLRVPRQLEGTDIVDKLGAKVDSSLTFIRHDGQVVPLSQYFEHEGQEAKPIIVTLGYFECPMLCSLVLNALTETLNKTSLTLGKDYRVLSFSIDPKETGDLAAIKRKNYLKAISHEDGDWDFFTSADGNVAKLAETLGFGYKFDSSMGEYAHGAGIFILTPEGVLSRTLWGISFDPFATKLALVEASSGKVGTVVDRILLSCFHYVPDSHKYGIYVFGAMRLGATLTVLILGSMLVLYWIGERRRRIKVA